MVNHERTGGTIARIGAVGFIYGQLDYPPGATIERSKLLEAASFSKLFIVLVQRHRQERQQTCTSPKGNFGDKLIGPLGKHRNKHEGSVRTRRLQLIEDRFDGLAKLGNVFWQKVSVPGNAHDERESLMPAVKLLDSANLLSVTPITVFCSGPGGIRTRDQAVMSRVL